MTDRSYQQVFLHAGIKDVEFAGFQVATNRFGCGERPAICGSSFSAMQNEPPPILIISNRRLRRKEVRRRKAVDKDRVTEVITEMNLNISSLYHATN